MKVRKVVTFNSTGSAAAANMEGYAEAEPKKALSLIKTERLDGGILDNLQLLIL